MKILAVDDSRVVLRALVATLEDAGHEVTGCAAYDDAIRAAGKQNYDVLVSDYLLGPLTGLQLSSITGLPTVLITGSNLTVGEMQEINRFRSAGWPVLTKPFFPLDLTQAIEDALTHEKAIHAAH
jgi:CheY-like chemotaxis protein